MCLLPWLRPVHGKAQSTHLNPSSVYLSEPTYYGETSAESHIYDVAYSGNATAINDIFFRDKKGHVSFSLQSTVTPGADAGSVTSAYLSDGTRLYLCVADGVDAGGNTIYTSKDAFVISDKREFKMLDVLVEVDNHRTYDKVTDITLKVCDLTIGSTAITARNSISAGAVYVLKANNNSRYLGVSDNNGTLSLVANSISASAVDNLYLWTFNAGTSANTYKLSSIYTNNLKYITSSCTLGAASSAATFTVTDGLILKAGSGLGLASGTTPTIGNSYNTYKWSLYSVTITEP